MPITVEGIPAVRIDDESTQALDFGATATGMGTAFSSPLVEISSNHNMNYRMGTAATAATTNAYLAAGAVMYRKVNVGDFLWVISSTGTATGVLGTVWASDVVE